MLQAKGQIWKWERKTGVSGLSGSTLGSVPLLRVRVGSPAVNQQDRLELPFPQRKFIPAQVHGFGLLGFLIPFLPFRLQLPPVVSPVA